MFVLGHKETDTSLPLFAPRVEMPKRQGAVKIAARGIFVGAKVVRGPDWDWGAQDGEWAEAPPVSSGPCSFLVCSILCS